MKNLFFAWLALAVSACGATALTSGRNEIKSEQLARILVHISVGPAAQEACDGWRWGAENSCPRLAIMAIEVVDKGASIFVPRSAFADLGLPRSATLRKVSTGFELLVQGGDGATSYEATYRFSGSAIKTRRVASGEFPRSAWERTDYSFPK